MSTDTTLALIEICRRLQQHAVEHAEITHSLSEALKAEGGTGDIASQLEAARRWQAEYRKLVAALINKARQDDGREAIPAKYAKDLIPGIDYIMSREGEWRLVTANRRAFLDHRLRFIEYQGNSLALPLNADDLIACNDEPNAPDVVIIDGSIGPLSDSLGLGER